LKFNSFGQAAGWWRLLPLALVCSALMLPRIAPLSGLLVAVAAGLWDLALGPSLGTWLVFGQLAYDVALYGRREVLPWLLRFAVVATVVAALVTLFLGNLALGAAVGVTLTLVFVVPVVTAVPVRQYRDRADRERERAEQIAEMAELHRRQALAEERARMARELHDVVANHLSAVAIHATAAQALLDSTDPSQLNEILAVIRENSVRGLAEMRRMVEVLREPGDPAVSQGLAEALPRLAAAAAQVRVTVEQVGEVRPLPPDVDHAAYRIVQESLTNAGKHAPGGTAAVRLEYLAESVVVTVDSSAPAPAAVKPSVAGAGMGLRGMRERVTLLGGAFSAGPADVGSVGPLQVAWRVRVDFPLAVAP
jgi:signal transduction histidine kinase